MIFILIAGLQVIFAGGLTDQQIIKQFEKMAKEQGVVKDKYYDMEVSLENNLQSDRFIKLKGDKEVKGLLLYSSREGGFLFKGLKGEGQIRFGMKKYDVEVKGFIGGAVIGGSAKWNLCILMGDVDEKSFPGKYKGSAVSGTAVKSDSVFGQLLIPQKQKKADATVMLYLISAGTGFTGDAGGMTLTFTYAEEK